ncbi:MAG: Zn-ribbon domain-containing OB-fold protein [Acidimicrobiia bacterium]
MNAASPSRPVPKPTPETAHFWEGTKRGEFLLQRCHGCRHTYFPPQPFCPRCTSDAIEVFKASGSGRLHSYVISHLGPLAPVILAMVELDEGPRLLSNLVDIEPNPAKLTLDMAVEVVFEPAGDQVLALFKPVVI